MVGVVVQGLAVLAVPLSMEALAAAEPQERPLVAGVAAQSAIKTALLARAERSECGS